MEKLQLGACAHVRVVVCGPAGCGKTCFVTAAAMETFPERVPPHVPPTLLPADALPDRVPALLVDTSSRAEDRAALVAALATAHVVVLCYALDVPRAATLAALRDEWLPELRRAGGAAPVILLGCKLDLCAASSPPPAPLAPELLAELPRLEASLECSAKTLVSVHEAVYAAQRAVLYPTPPLFDAGAQALAPDAVAALRRIFAVCDTDADGALSSSELNAFQEACFGAALSALEVEDVRRVVSDRMPCGSGVTPSGDGLTLPGFLYLHALFIEHGRADTVWAVLRCFGYDTSLRLSTDALGGAGFCDKLQSARPPDAAVELSDRAAAFLDAAFAHAAGSGGALHSLQLESLFVTAPGGAAAATIELGWRDSTNWEAAFAAGGGGLSRYGFLALWAMSAALNPRAVLEHVVYLGYRGSPASVLVLGRRRGAERARRRTGARMRSTLQAYVCGPHRAGRLALLDALASLGNGGLLRLNMHKDEVLSAAEQCSSLGVPPGSVCWTPRDSDVRASGRSAAAVFEVTPEAPFFAGIPQGSNALGAPSAPARVTLVLRELEDGAARPAPAAHDVFAAADLLVFVFDPTERDSFTAAADELAAVAMTGRVRVPALLVAADVDTRQPSALHDSRMPTWDAGVVDAFCVSLGLALPLPLRLRAAEDAAAAAHVFARLVAEAAAAEPKVPETCAAKTMRLRRTFMRRSLTYGAGAVVLCGAGVMVFRWCRRYDRPTWQN